MVIKKVINILEILVDYEIDQIYFVSKYLKSISFSN